MRRMTYVPAIILASAVALTSCAAPSGDGGDPAVADSLVLGATAAPASLDAAASEWANRAPFYQAVYDTLLLATPEGTIEPFLADEWSYNDDQTVLTLGLRDDVTFTDGTALTAEVVAQNIERFRTGSAANAGLLRSIDSVAAQGESTVVITLVAPDPALLSYFTRDAGLIASAESFDDPEVATEPVGSGPYMLDSERTVIGTSYVYTANPDYWNPELQHYQDLTINVYADATSGLNAVKAGEVDGIRIASNDNLAEYEAAGWTINGNEIDVQGLVLFDRAGAMNPALGDVRVRQAINYAFDREALLQALQAGYGEPTTQMFPERSVAFDPSLDDVYSYDPDRARELLAEAGYADGFALQLPSTAVLSPTTWSLLGQQLEDIGISVEFVDAANNYTADEIAGKYAAGFQPLEQNADWQLIQYVIAPTASWNPFDYADPEVDALIEAVQYGDEEAAAELNEYLVEQAWFAPWFRKQNSFGTAPGTSVEMMPTNLYPAIYDFTPAE